MKIKEYFNRLPNYLSANFFALLGFTNFVYHILAAMVTFFMIYVVGSNDTLISRNIPNTLLCGYIFYLSLTTPSKFCCVETLLEFRKNLSGLSTPFCSKYHTKISCKFNGITDANFSTAWITISACSAF